MGKKRIVKNSADEGASKASASSSKRKLDVAILHVQSTYNNTKLILTDMKGNSVAWSSSGSLGFKGAKKGTPFAAQQAAEIVARKVADQGMREVEVEVSGPGSGRETAIRVLSSTGLRVKCIRDVTPIPHNGCRPSKRRRV